MLRVGNTRKKPLPRTTLRRGLCGKTLRQDRYHNSSLPSHDLQGSGRSALASWWKRQNLTSQNQEAPRGGIQLDLKVTAGISSETNESLKFYSYFCCPPAMAPNDATNKRESDNDNGKQYKNVCITINRPDTKSSASEMTYIVSSGALNSTHSLTHSTLKI